MVVHLREVAGQHVNLEKADAAIEWKMEEVDALGSTLRPVKSLSFQPYETKFVRIWK
jgi:hypothetical protein